MLYILTTWYIFTIKYWHQISLKKLVIKKFWMESHFLIIVDYGIKSEEIVIDIIISGDFIFI